MGKLFLISTTGASSPVILDDLGARSFTHPTASYDLTSEYSLEELRGSADLRAAIDGADLTADFDGVAITTGALFDEYMVDFDHVQTAQNTTDIAANTLAISALEKGGRRLKKVINYVDNTAVPPTEVLGDRDILDDTGASNAAWDGAAALSLVEFNGTTWDVFAVLEGDVAYVDVENKDRAYVDDGAPYWELRDGLLEQDATEVPYTVTTPADWNVVPTEVGGALDELADRVEDLENAASPAKKTYTYSAGEDGNLNGDRDLQRTGDQRTSVTPFIVPIAGTIWGITIASKQGVSATFSIQIWKNGASVHTEAISAADKKVNAALALAVVAGDEIRVRYIQTAGATRDIGVEVYGVEA
jgi:hypothetical protein